MTHYVYEFIARDGSHLYVGCTGDLPQRIRTHHAKEWWGDVFRIEVDTYPTAFDALAAERERIELYQPTHNVMFTERHDLDKGRRTMQDRMAKVHAGGDLCPYKECRECTDRAHSLKVTCSNYMRGCRRCQVFAPLTSRKLRPIGRRSA